MKLVPALVVAGALVMTATASSHPLARNAGIVWGADDGIYGANVDGSNRHLITRYKGGAPTDDYEFPDYSPSGRQLAYNTIVSATCLIHVLRPMGGRKRTLALGENCNWDPSWSPDEEYLGFVDAEAVGGAGISIVSLSSSGVRRLTKPRYGRYDDSPAWSPTGNAIAFTRSVRGQPPVIYTVTLDGRARWITKGASPSWSPSGRWLAFTWGDGIYRVNADGGGRTRLARIPGVSGPSWSPDGRKILFTRRSSIWVMNADGTARRRVLAVSGNLFGAGWRPG